MEENAPRRLSRQEGRRFALTLAGAFAVITLIANWRGHGRVLSFAGILSALLLIAGMTIPGSLGPLERAWMKLGLLLSRITSPVFLGIVYFLVITPTGLVRRLFGNNSIVHKPVDGGFWKTRELSDREARRRRMERQF